MPWRECSVMEERLLFVARLLEGEAMSEVCRQFGISRKTGYKIFNRYKDEGLEALSDRSRRPVRYANQLPEQVERLVRQGLAHFGHVDVLMSVAGRRAHQDFWQISLEEWHKTFAVNLHSAFYLTKALVEATRELIVIGEALQ